MRPRAKKRTYHHGDLPRALVASALELIERKGPDALSLREAAAAIGVTHGAAYRHFEDKTALLAAVAEEGYRALARELAVAIPADATTPEARLSALGGAYVAFALARPAYYRVMSGPRLDEDGRFPSLEGAIAEAFGLMVAEIERGRAVGAFGALPARDVAIAFWVAAHGFIDLVLRRRVKVKTPRVAVEYFQRLVAPMLDGMSRAK